MATFKIIKWKTKPFAPMSPSIANVSETMDGAIVAIIHKKYSNRLNDELNHDCFISHQEKRPII